MKARHILCNFSLLVLLLVPSARAEHLAEKLISREFSIQTDGRLLIDNRYGDIDIAVGPAGKIKIDVRITSDASSESKARENLERVSIAFTEGINRVEARTSIASGSSWSWWGSNNAKLRIDYKVLVPADVYLELENKYGGIFIETSNRDVSVGLGYGDIRCGDLAGNLQLDMAYSKGSLSRIRNGDLNLSYAELEMEDAGAIEVDMKYSELSMGALDRLRVTSAYGDLSVQDAREIQYTGKYDDIEIDRVGVIHAQTGYAGIEIDVLHQQGTFDMKYGGITIRQVSRQFSRIDLSTAYTGVELGFEPGAAFSVDAVNNYCDVDHSGLTVSERIQKGGSLTFKGTRGSGGGQVIARMNYGELEIREP